jgi:uncharacterized membrane protein YtjA (UPF0391 family)
MPPRFVWVVSLQRFLSQSADYAGLLGLLGRFQNEVGISREIPTRVEARERERETRMLGWTVVFLIIAIIAGILGFVGIAAAAAGIAKILFIIFIILFIISLVVGRRSRV